MSSSRDITILGGGLAGLSLAIQIRQQLPDATITVIEKRDHPVPEAAHKVGESTVEVAAHYFGEVLGVKQHILEDQLPKFGLRFFFPDGDNGEIQNRLELGGKRFAPCPSYQLDRGRFENYLGDLCLERGIEFLDRAEVLDLEVAKGRQPHQITYQRDDETHQLKTRWMVDASGRRALLKRKLNLQKDSPHKASSAWFRFATHIKIDEWSDCPAWLDGHADKTARFYSTNHLMGEGYWVWLIPLASGSTSMGIVAGDDFHPLSDFNTLEKAVDWLERHEPQAANAVKANLDSIQDFRAIKHYSVECEQVFSQDRWGITGEAGFFHDPFYSPGSDFIAFANTFLTDLISRDLNGKGIRMRSFAYDRIYKRFYYGTATAYQDQYQLFGNPAVMPVKILWDYLIYWSITGFLFMQGRMCQQTMYLRILRKLSRFGKLNHLMQEVFRQWHARNEDEAKRGVVNISNMPIIRQWNQQLADDVSDGEFVRRFSIHLAQMETLAVEIIEHAGLDIDCPFKRSKHPDVQQDVFAHVLNPPQRPQPAATADADPQVAQ